MQLCGKSEEKWEREASYLLQKDEQRLTSLLNAFHLHLRSVEGVSCTKAKLAIDHIEKYLRDRQAGNLMPRTGLLEEALGKTIHIPRVKPPEHALCPDDVTMDVYLSGLFHFMMPWPHDAAAFFSSLPAWLRFLEFAGLLGREQKERTLKEMKPLALSLVKILERHVDNERLPHDVASAWSE